MSPLGRGDLLLLLLTPLLAAGTLCGKGWLDGAGTDADAAPPPAEVDEPLSAWPLLAAFFLFFFFLLGCGPLAVLSSALAVCCHWCGATTGTVCSQCVGLPLGQFAVNCVGLQLGLFAVNCVGLPLGQFAVSGVGLPLGQFAVNCVGLPLGQFAVHGVGLPLRQFVVNGVGLPLGQFTLQPGLRSTWLGRRLLRLQTCSLNWTRIRNFVIIAPNASSACHTSRPQLRVPDSGWHTVACNLWARPKMARTCLGTVKCTCTALTGPGFFTGVTAPVAFFVLQRGLATTKMCAEYTTDIPQTYSPCLYVTLSRMDVV